ncbi:MAG TPA: HDIG domain-containing protein [Thermomicrobiales bacterium]|nr:HDIG domain-containing protein [Thermomicrobiales bacterium]
MPLRWIRRQAIAYDTSWRDVTRLVLFSISLLALSVISVAVDWRQNDATLQAGSIADRTIKAPETLSFTSELRTSERRQEAYDDQRNVVTVHDDNVRAEQLTALRQFLDNADELRVKRDVSREEAAADLQATLGDLNVADATRILALSSASWERVRSESLRLVGATLADPIKQDEVRARKDNLADRLSPQLSSEEQSLVLAVGRPFIRANVHIDDERTLANRQAAAAAVEPVTVNILAGQAIVRDGDIVTTYDVEKLEQFGLLNREIGLSTRLGRSALMAILTLVTIAYLLRFHPRLWRGRQLLLLSVVMLAPIVVARLTLPHSDVQYLFPAAASAMLLAVLLDYQIALTIGALLSLYIAVIADMSMELVFLYAVASVAGALVVWNAERTIRFVWAGVAVALSMFAVGLAFNALTTTVTWGLVGERLIQVVVAGALASSLTFLSFSLIGSALGITTHLQLMELAHPNQPLLYRLAREAPGTYHHSIVVSNLAESAVEAVGGDPLFARVAVLYHDVGKIVRPTFFIENQGHIENPHDLLDPRTSARVILDHVSDGVRLARKARLPAAIIAIIEQHHGTSLIRYFYQRAIDSGNDVSEAEFRYPGPKPQSKEAGVIMLADSVEATVRAAAGSGRLVRPKDQSGEGKDTLEAIVTRVIRERVDDGQLDDCDLTLREIERIRRTFIQMLEGVYHPRVEYPASAEPAAPAAAAATSPAGD